MEKARAFWRTKVVIPTTSGRSVAIYRDMWVIETDITLISKAVIKAQVFGWTVDKTKEITLEKTLTNTNESFFIDR